MVKDQCADCMLDALFTLQPEGAHQVQQADLFWGYSRRIGNVQWGAKKASAAAEACASSSHRESFEPADSGDSEGSAGEILASTDGHGSPGSTHGSVGSEPSCSSPCSSAASTSSPQVAVLSSLVSVCVWGLGRQTTVGCAREAYVDGVVRGNQGRGTDETVGAAGNGRRQDSHHLHIQSVN